jgi:hypothetical protein
VTNPKLDKALDDFETMFCGTCQFVDTEDFANEYQVDELEMCLALDEYGIIRCAQCGWWQYPGDYCTEHDHEELICNECCEENGEEAH